MVIDCQLTEVRCRQARVRDGSGRWSSSGSGKIPPRGTSTAEGGLGPGLGLPRAMPRGATWHPRGNQQLYQSRFELGTLRGLSLLFHPKQLNYESRDGGEFQRM
ncbi:hypothetical protein Tco_0563302, partial [Tanacetum coccineum]